ncbi:MAG TPA: DUF192 domain-containing protein [Candidatus Paceibacterota bacterium]
MLSKAPVRENAAVTLNGAVFKAIVADTPASRERGLSGSKPLASDEAMLFVFEIPDDVGFWMKDMNYSIDIVWLDANMKVIHIEKDVAPETYPTVFYPEGAALYVLEFSAGTADRIGLKLGDIASASGGK